MTTEEFTSELIVGEPLIPSIGSIVHFVYGDQHVPAIVTDPAFVVREDGKPDWTGQALTVVPVGIAPFTTVALCDENHAPATWHWPELEPIAV